MIDLRGLAQAQILLKLILSILLINKSSRKISNSYQNVRSFHYLVNISHSLPSYAITYPPMPFDCGCTAPRQSRTDIAESTAEPPLFKISVPISVHTGLSDATAMPRPRRKHGYYSRRLKNCQKYSPRTL